MSVHEGSNISSVVYDLKRRSSAELGSDTSARLLSTGHDSILEWIRAQRMSQLPPREATTTSYLAAQLAYGYCALLLELGKENAPALMISFGLFYNMSGSLVNILERTEMFALSQDIKEQLVLCLSDLVTLVASVSTHFHKAISGLMSSSISINIYNIFPTQIKAFIDRCNKTAESMWRHQLIKEGWMPTKAIKSWVAPEDQVLRNLVSSTSHVAHDREELTCLWMAPYLTRFFKSDKKTLSISGKQGCGKTVLASVVVDYLQHPIGGVTYSTIFVPINSRVPTETSSHAIAKAILTQLLDKRIGNVELLQVLTAAMQRSHKARTMKQYEDIVWTALADALASQLPGAKELVIVVDGMDEALGGEQALLSRLNAAVKNVDNLRVITLGSDKATPSQALSSIAINDDLIFDDIVAVVRGQFDGCKVFSSMSELEQETAVTRIATASNGSFLWAKLASKRIRQETTVEALRKGVDSMVDSKPAIKDLTRLFLQNPDVKAPAKHLLLWLATAERPLSIRELTALSVVQLEKQSVLDPADPDLLGTLKPVNSLVFLQDGLAYLRHGLIRTALIELFSKGKLTSGIKDRHEDLAVRLLLYTKSSVTEQHEISLSAMTSHDSNQLISKYPLLDFAARHWPTHARSIDSYSKDGNLAANLWQRKPAPVYLANLTMMTDVYRQLLTPKHLVTLQSVILLATAYQRVELTDKAIPLLYDATISAKNVLGIRDTVTMQISSLFVQMTSSSESRQFDVSKREEILLILVECYKIQYGKTSENVISTLRILVEHYRATGQEQKAQQLSTSIEKPAAENGVSLLLDVEEHDELLEGVRSYDFEFSLTQAEKYATEGRNEMAEHIFIEVWQRASREYRVHHSDVWEERKLKAVLAYSRFLARQKRDVDVSAILSSVWQDYKSRNAMAMTETSATLFHQMATVMKEAGLCSESLSVLKHCASYFQSTNRTQSSSYKEIEQTIKTSSREIMEMMSASDKTRGNIDQTTINAVFTLAGLYTSQHRWHDATRLIKRVLRSIWPSLFASSVQDVSAPSKHVDSCIDLAQRLASCYHTRRRLTKEGDLRLRIYRALRSSRKVDDQVRERATNQLISFLDSQSNTEKIIKIRQEMLEDFSAHYGPEHPSVIKMLWQLAELTKPRPVHVEYYQKIIRAVNKNSTTVKQEAFEPVTIVAGELWNKGLFDDALGYYKMLFETFLKDPKVSPKFQDQSFTREVFNRYVHCVRNSGSGFSVIHKITTEYRNQCKTVNPSATKSRPSLYEELLKIDSAEVNRKDISATLDSIYEEQVDLATSNKSQTVSSSQLERAVTVLQQRTVTIRKTHGWAHEESLSKMTELATLRKQQNQVELLTKELKEATVQVLNHETSSSRLIAAASSIASSYISADQTQKAAELLQELYRQIIMKDTTNAEVDKFDLSSRGRDSLVFLAQLEYSLRRNSATMTEILATLTTQYVYFAELRALHKSKSSSFHQVTVATARLYHCLLNSERLSAAARVFGDFAHYFGQTQGKRVHIQKAEQVNIFLQTLLQHFSTHRSHNFVRSVGIAGNDGVVHLLRAQRYDTACDLALATFSYISASDEYRTPVIAKLVLTLGMSIAGRDLEPQPTGACRKNMLEASSTIVRDVLHVLSDLKVSIEHISLNHLNKMIGLLGEQRDYRTLSWLLTILWHSRQAQSNWNPSITLLLGQRYILARYLVGDSTAALRLAEDIVYNCRRVHGTRHPATLQMSSFLTQLYSSIAQRYQSQKAGGQDMANRYYKKSAAVHENILRVFTDPSYAEMEAGLDGSISPDSGSNYGLDAVTDLPSQSNLSDGQYARQHLRLLKLAIERLGSWPKEYQEYERLNADIFREFPNELKGVEGVEKWNLSSYGHGKAEAGDDLLDPNFAEWELTTQEDGYMEDEL
ncbi:unnamed protein product [Parascedosporium putredinis]|uniref:Nephrocystin 3-like N-terminal domain-containing protein n=1 Tax=Parascedosporium putredinis TaxID=1442378 RepID=A0A9P1GZ61_9PEZI|nr:unnamed protein product [Parascedosporium putredinis]CAI7992508.1 unnamed protein product [Parascedosporium putredinis]